MEELTQLAEMLKDHLGGQVDEMMEDVEEFGGGGLLDELGGLMGDAMAEKKSRMVSESLQ